MTFAELFAEVGKALPKDSYSIEVDAWCHRHEAGDDNQTLEWTIWNARTNKRYRGATPEAALERLRTGVIPAEYAALHTVVIP
jgi:hypothetical protein